MYYFVGLFKKNERYGEHRQESIQYGYGSEIYAVTKKRKKER